VLSRILNVEKGLQNELGTPEAHRAEYRRLMLTAYMAVICFAVAVFYAIFDFSEGIYYAAPTYATLIVFSIASLTLLRLSYFKVARIILFLATNAAIAWSAMHDPQETGSVMFLIPIGLSSFFIFGFVNIRISIILSSLSLILFFVLHFADLSEFRQNPSQDYVQMSFVINFVVVFIISIIGVFFLHSVNSDFEAELMKNKSSLEAKNSELEKINLEMDRFVYSVSHDLRSPLTSILGLVQIAGFSNDPKELKEIFEMVKGRVKVQEHFIEEIIDYSRNNRTDINLEYLKLNELINTIVSSLRFSENFSKVEVRNSVNESVVIHSDKIRLSIVLRNLISNAIKYADLTKGTSFVEVTIGPENSIIVRDNGIGIPAAHLPNIFRMFYRATEKSAGSGLGLFISSEAILRLGGEIKVDSVVGEGTVFRVVLGKSVV
jgi:signal transduction histidine kinase